VSKQRISVVLEWDPDDELWVSYVPSVGGISTYGETREEALAMTEEAIVGYYEAAKKEGLASPPQVELVELEVALP
jgi:predicted RNase H-like HicB family nuclease